MRLDMALMFSKISPPPFTVPSDPTTNGRKSGQRTTLRAPAALADYQLPDPTWRWVRYVMVLMITTCQGSHLRISKFWMVDMRGDGEVSLFILGISCGSLLVQGSTRRLRVQLVVSV